MKRHTQTDDDASFGLCPDRIRVDSSAAVQSADHLVNGDLSLFVDRNLCHVSCK